MVFQQPGGIAAEFHSAQRMGQAQDHIQAFFLRLADELCDIVISAEVVDARLGSCSFQRRKS